MDKWAINFATMLAAVLAALFVFQRLQPKPKADINAASLLTPAQQAVHDDATQAMRAVTLPLSEYYSNTGKWPQQNADAGIPEPTAFRGKSLTRLDVSGLTVTLTFDGASGVDGGRVVFTGEATAQLVMGINWRCTSPSFPDIGVAIADCAYARP